MKSAQLLAEIERFNEKSTPFDIGFHVLVEGIKSAHAGIAFITTPASQSASVREYFEQAVSFLSEAKSLLAEEDALSPELKSLIDRYTRFCGRLLTEL